MKYILLFVYGLVPGILSYGNPVIHFARRARIPVRNVTFCLERTWISIDTVELFQTVEEKDLRRAELQGPLQTYGCFLACLSELQGTMVGGKLQLQAAVDYVEKVFDSDLDARSKIHKAVEICATLAEKNDDECVTALTVKTCTWKFMKDYFNNPA